MNTFILTIPHSAFKKKKTNNPPIPSLPPIVEERQDFLFFSERLPEVSARKAALPSLASSGRLR